MVAVDKNDAEKSLERFFGDISKSSAAKQICIGAASGWLTGFVTVKVGKMVAIGVGGGIILLQIANDQGYIQVNWNKLNSKKDKLLDKVEEKVTGEGPKFMDKAERYLDRKLDQAECALRQRGKATKKWYSTFIGNDKGCCVNDFHIFLGAFIAGVALGIGSA